MDKKTRSVVSQIVIVAVFAVGLSVYSVIPKKTEEAQMRLEVLQAHRDLKDVLFAVQQYATDHNGGFPSPGATSHGATSHAIGNGTHVVSNVIEAADFLQPDYLAEIPTSPFVTNEIGSAPVFFGKHTGDPPYWYTYVQGPGSAEPAANVLQQKPPALPSRQWYAVTNGLRSPGYIYRDTYGFVSMGSTR